MFENVLKQLASAYGPSGREENVREALRRNVEPLCDSVRTDALGNLIAFRKGTSGKKLMLTAHMDQIGLLVTDIDDTGFLRIAAVGGIQPAIAIGRKVAFQNGVRGVVYYETENKKHGEAALYDMFIDIGARNKAEALSQVQLGDVAVFHASLVLRNDRVTGGALDNRLGCALLTEALREPCAHDLYAVFTVQ
jgi:endoglucanase